MSAHACWRCGAATAPAPSCPACGALQPLPPEGDLFEVLGLPRRHPLDAAELERRFRDRARQWHPDRFTRASPRERRIAAERSARLNEAYRTLREPRRRAAYLVSLLDSGALPAASRAADPAFLGAQLELRELLARARAAGDGVALARIAEAARERLLAIDGAVAAQLAAEDHDPQSIRAAAAALVRARFEEALLEAAEPGAASPAGGRG